MNHYVLELNKANRIGRVGRKAHQLYCLQKWGFTIPKTYVYPFYVYDDYLSRGGQVLEAVNDELQFIINESESYSIRSSASLEDDRHYSFADQLESYLGVKSSEQVLQAIVDIWESMRSGRINAYLSKVGCSGRDTKMAVMIQHMVPAEISGVVFTRNPVNGLDEILVEMVPGLSAAFVQTGVTPVRWVYKWGQWTSKPRETYYEPVIRLVVQQAIEISKHYRRPVDMEWAYDGEKIYWLQLRELTILKGLNIYSNRISKEFMPGLIKPLVWSVNIPVVNSSWKSLFVELIGGGAKNININDLAKSFYYRAYFNMGVIGDIFDLLGFPRESIEIVMGVNVARGQRPKLRPGLKTMRYLPRMLYFALRMSLFAGKIERFLVKQRNKYDRLSEQDINSLNMAETLANIEALFQTNTASSYYMIVSQMLMGFYNMLLKRLLSRKEIDIRNVSFPEVTEALRDIDVNYHISQLYGLYRMLPKELQIKIRSIGYKNLSEFSELNEFRVQFDHFLDKFGYLSESGNDFSRPHWRETPDLVMDILLDYRPPVVKEPEQIKITSIPCGLDRGVLLKYLYRKACQYRVYRERVNFIFNYGYGLFRRYFLRLAEIFVNKDYIREKEDIFYLNFGEIKDIVQAGEMSNNYREKLIQRKKEIAQCKDIELPEVIVGDEMPPALVKSSILGTLHGVAVAKGYCEGRVRVIRQIQDFPKAKTGDILVIPFSDVSWSPLFLKAKAVIAESGGMLSHCAIVAREYGIPAVVSVAGALKLRDGTKVAVDGCRGEVMILE